MKHVIIALALMLPFTTATATDEDVPVERILAVIEKLNLVSNEVAICQAYYTYQGNSAETLRFALHGEFMVDIALEYFNDIGIEVVGEDPSDIYYNNVEKAKANMPNFDSNALAELETACADLNNTIEKAKEL